MSCNGGENWLWKMSDCYHCVMQHWWDRGLPVRAAQLFITRPGDVDEVRLWKVRLVSLWNVTLVRQSIACESCTTLYHQAQWCWLGLTVKGLTGLTVLHMIVVKTDCDCERRQRKWIPPVLGFLCVCFCTMLPVSSWSATVYQYHIVYFDSFFFFCFHLSSHHPAWVFPTTWCSGHWSVSSSRLCTSFSCLATTPCGRFPLCIASLVKVTSCTRRWKNWRQSM